MSADHLIQRYEELVARADFAFQSIEGAYSECVRCELHCSDCCHAVFGIFLIEAAYLQQDFNLLDSNARRAALLRARKADEGLEILRGKIQKHGGAAHEGGMLARERLRCPLLDESDECILYDRRPITCRVYGIPTRIRGRAHVCGKSGFKKGASYPSFNLDETYRELYALSHELLANSGSESQEKASFLISVSKAITTSLEDILTEDLEKPHGTD
jgi:Fe-S-cluster containining protein